jgi:hypothetical protein
MAHPPATRKTFEDLAAFCDQADGYLAGLSTTHPDLSLLIGGNPTQFRELVADTFNGAPAIRFLVVPRTTTYGPRWAYPAGMLGVRGLQLYGGGINVNHNGKELSYVRMGGPKRKNVQLGRILADVPPGAIARQDPATGFRLNDPAHFAAMTSEATRNIARGRPTREPEAGRDDAVENALAYHAKNNAKTDIGLGATEYEAFLWRCFAILDDLHLHRLSTSIPTAA